MPVAVVRPGASPDRARLLPLLRELGDLKRTTSAGRAGSIATRLFRSAWRQLVAGQDVRAVAIGTTAACIAAARLGDLDMGALVGLGLGRDEAIRIQQDAVRDFAGFLDPDLIAALCHGVEAAHLMPGALLPFVEQLADQPRAGVTCPGRPRIMLQPAENHAEHCLMVAVYGVILAESYRADPAIVFLAALAHHLHNAAMPDSGFTGEMLLGEHLGPVMERATGVALGQLAPDLRHAVVDARAILPDATTPEGRAFHAADVIDRVLEIDQHLAAARVTMADVLGPMALVHDGPVKPFHDRVLAEMGLP